MHNSILPGWLKVEEYLQGHLRRMFNRVRMTLHVFTALCMLLKQRGLLADSQGLVVEEQLFMFLTIISQSENSRATQDDFQHSGEIISRHFTTILEALCTLQREFITQNVLVIVDFNDMFRYLCTSWEVSMYDY